MQPDPSLLAAILAEPENDLPRLLMADWLDERGEAARAEFIRVQCRLARITHSALCRDGCGCEVGDLCRRERELLDQNWRLWVDQPFHDMWHHRQMDYRDVFRFHRGFVAEITCSWQDWQRHADAIRAATPLRVVRLTTMPERLSDRFWGDFAATDPAGRTICSHRWPGVTFHPTFLAAQAQE